MADENTQENQGATPADSQENPGSTPANETANTEETGAAETTTQNEAGSQGAGAGENGATTEESRETDANAGDAQTETSTEPAQPSTATEEISEAEELKRLQDKRHNMPLNGEEIKRFDELKAKQEAGQLDTDQG